MALQIPTNVIDAFVSEFRCAVGLAEKGVQEIIGDLGSAKYGCVVVEPGHAGCHVASLLVELFTVRR